MLLASVCILCIRVVFALNCQPLLEPTSLEFVNWNYVEQCLSEIRNEPNTNTANDNIWNLTKMAFAGVENIPPTIYQTLGISLTAIPQDDLTTISFEVIEMIEAFGAIRSTDMSNNGFSETQLQLIASKVRSEWLGKTPKTYSEYDLRSMGEIICYLNASDISDIHVIAFKEAVEWIGAIVNCPMQQLQALAGLATHSDGFGPPRTWSTLVVSIVGNLVNGLSQSDLETIDKEKLHLNRFYAKKHLKASDKRDASTN